MVRSSIGCKGFAATATITVAIILSCAAATQVSASQPSQQPTYWHPWFEIGGYHNSRDEDSTGTRGTNRGETTIFAPISGSQPTLLFGQMTAKFFDDTAKEGNLAFGYRRMTTSGFNLGAWIGGDARLTDINNNFWQLSGGFEALSKNVDMRLNWYGPVSKPQSGVAGYAQVQLQGSQIFMTGGEEVGLKGVDGEIGFRLPTEYLNVNPNIFELRAYGGGYHFYSDDAEDNVTGVKGRLELRVNDVIAALPGSRLTVHYEVSHDDVRDTRHDVGLRVRIPLNGDQSAARSLASLSHQQRRMLDGIERDTDIVTGRSKRESVGDALTGTDFDRVAYASTDVTTTSTTAGANSLIILNGTVTGGQALQSNQTLQGGGKTIQVRGRRSGTVASFTAPGAAGSLTSPQNNDHNLILTGSNIHVSGLTIVGRGRDVGNGYGVSTGEGTTNVFLSYLKIKDIGDTGVYIYDGDEFADNIFGLIGLEITNVGDDGIGIEDNNTVLILGGTITNAGDTGIEADDSNKIYIAGLSILDSDYGIYVNSENELWLNNVKILGATTTALDLSYFGNTATIDNLAIAGTQTNLRSVNGVQSDSDKNTITLTNSSISDTEHAVRSEGEEDEIRVSNTAISNSIYGAYLRGTDSDVQILNTTFSDITGDVVFIENDVSLLFANNTISGTPPSTSFFNFDDDTTTILAGSTGNTNTTGGAVTCVRDAAATVVDGDNLTIDGIALSSICP